MGMESEIRAIVREMVERELDVHFGRIMNDAQPVKIAPLLSVKEAAKILKISQGTLYSWKKSGRGPNFRMVNCAVRYSIQDIEEYIESTRVVINGGSRDVDHTDGEI